MKKNIDFKKLLLEKRNQQQNIPKPQEVQIVKDTKPLKKEEEVTKKRKRARRKTKNEKKEKKRSLELNFYFSELGRLSNKISINWSTTTSSFNSSIQKRN